MSLNAYQWMAITAWVVAVLGFWVIPAVLTFISTNLDLWRAEDREKERLQNRKLR
jgi:hypothetical protein